MTCQYCLMDETLFSVTYCRKGGRWQDGIMCQDCIDELRSEKVDFGIIEKI